MEVTEIILGVGLGVALAAACGFRVFVPLLVISLASRFELVTLQEGQEWVGSWWAVAAFGSATVLEVGAYYVPWLDNLLDTIGVPAATVAGVLVTYTAIGDAPPWLAWSLAVVGGGGTAATVKVGMTTVRGASTATTGGLMNWAVASLENVLAMTVSLLAIVLPFLACLLAVVALLLFVRYALRRKSPVKSEAEMLS